MLGQVLPCSVCTHHYIYTVYLVSIKTEMMLTEDNNDQYCYWQCKLTKCSFKKVWEVTCAGWCCCCYLWSQMRYDRAHDVCLEKCLSVDSLPTLCGHTEMYLNTQQQTQYKSNSLSIIVDVNQLPVISKTLPSIKAKYVIRRPSILDSAHRSPSSALCHFLHSAQKRASLASRSISKRLQKRWLLRK